MKRFEVLNDILDVLRNGKEDELKTDLISEGIEAIQWAVSESEKVQRYEKALERVRNVALNNDDYALVADTQQVVIDIVDEVLPCSTESTHHRKEGE